MRVDLWFFQVYPECACVLGSINTFLLLVTFQGGSAQRHGKSFITQWQMSCQDASVYKMLSGRPLANLLAKLDLNWHLFSKINILFWCENSLAVPWTACTWWMMAEMEDVLIFSWLSACRALFKWARHCLQVLLKWSFIVNLPFMAVVAQATLLLAKSSCVHRVPCTL